MNERILKHKLILESYCQEIELAKEAQILDIQIQVDTPCIWTLENVNAVKVLRNIEMYDTGESVPVSEKKTYIGMIQNKGLVHHYFIVNE